MYETRQNDRNDSSKCQSWDNQKKDYVKVNSVEHLKNKVVVFFLRKKMNKCRVYLSNKILQ